MFLHKKRIFAIISVTVATGAILVANQNCAPPSSSLSSRGNQNTNRLSESDKAEFGLGDSVKEYAYEDLVKQGGKVEIAGRCPAQFSGAVFSYRLRNDQGEQILKGLTECEEGQFTVSIRQSDKVKCGHPYTLEMRWGKEAKKETQLKLSCSLQAAGAQ